MKPYRRKPPKHRQLTLHESAILSMRELLDAFQEADRHAGGTLLGPFRSGNVKPLSDGLATVVMRLLFVLHSGQPPLIGPGSAGGRGYAWRQILETFRLFHVRFGDVGGLFDPATFPFLACVAPSRPPTAPLLRDDLVQKFLEVLVPGGRPWSAADLELSRVGAIYESLTAIGIRMAEGDSVVLAPDHVVIDLSSLAEMSASQRITHLKEAFGRGLSRKMTASVQSATDSQQLHAALARRASPLFSGFHERGTFFLVPSDRRRDIGAHYTPQRLAAGMVNDTLDPILERLGPSPMPEQILQLRVCDPAMGAGAFLVEARKYLTRRLLTAYQAHPQLAPLLDPAPHAQRLVVERCLFGVDHDPVALRIARLVVGGGALLAPNLRCGDSLVGRPRFQLLDQPGPTSLAEMERSAAAVDGFRPFHWYREFAEVFSPAQGGFNAVVGNPPWMAYAGRAAQPISKARFDYFLAVNPAFRRFRTLHGLFIRRCAELLRPGGRLGLVVPTSVSDLGGYQSTRDAHDSLCIVDAALRDFGSDAFEGVFQPAMGLLSTRRHSSMPAPAPSGKTWELSRTDLDSVGSRLLDRLSSLPCVPAELFAERGIQTIGSDVSHLRKLPSPKPPYVLGVRQGADVGPFHAGRVRHYLNPTTVRARIRPSEDWKEVSVLIRQTARFPVAALSDGAAFRNSILAGFGKAGWSPESLLAYLNSSPVRWFHYMRNRDARQGMPQVKISHLRALPHPPEAGVTAGLGAIGKRLGTRNAGASQSEQRELDELVGRSLHLDEAEVRMVEVWAASHPAP